MAGIPSATPEDNSGSRPYRGRECHQRAKQLYRWTLKVDGQPVRDDIPSLRAAIQFLKEKYAPNPETSDVIVEEDGVEKTASAAVLSDYDIDYWSRYGGARKFKTEQETRDWVFYQLERFDEQYGDTFGRDGADKNRAKADAMPVYREGRAFRLGKKPAISKERLGTEEPDGNAPDVDWYARDNQDSSAVSEASILRDYNGGKPATIYHAYVPASQVPEPVLAEDAVTLVSVALLLGLASMAAIFLETYE